MSRHVEGRRQFMREGGALALSLLAPGWLHWAEFLSGETKHYDLEFCLPPQKEAIEIISAQAEVLTRPTMISGCSSFDLSGWEGKTVSYPNKLLLKQEIVYGPEFKDSLAVHVITLQVRGLGGDPNLRPLIFRVETPFGHPPDPQRGGWPTTGRISALAWYYEADGRETDKPHRVWLKEYAGAFGTAVDIRTPIGTPVVSTFAGQLSTGSAYIDPNYGNQAILITEEGVAVSFAHLSKYWDGSETPGACKIVQPGDLIGYTGQSGTGAEYPHLHYEVHGFSVHSPGYLQIQDILPKEQLVIGMPVSP